MKDDIRIFYLLGRSVLRRTLARKLTCEAVILRFLEMGDRWCHDGPRPAKAYLAEFTAFHRGVKVLETDPEGQDDLLDLAFGTDGPVIADKPLDARNLTDDQVHFAEDDELCFMFERRVFPSLKDCSDPDDDNVAMRVYLSFGTPAALRKTGVLDGDVHGACAEIEDYYLNIDEIREFTSNPSVARFLRFKPNKVSVMVTGAG